jgi:hypothetical protein
VASVDRRRLSVSVILIIGVGVAWWLAPFLGALLTVGFGAAFFLLLVLPAALQRRIEGPGAR